MAITQNFLNYDSYFISTSGDKLLINDWTERDIYQSNNFLDKIMTIYSSSETISSKPSCDCREREGLYLVGTLCNSCGTEVKDISEKVEPLLWFRKINNEYPFINLTFWLMLSNILDSRTDWLQYLTDPRYRTGVNIPQHVISILDFLGGVRSYRFFIENMENILNYISTLPKFKTAEKQKDVLDLLELYINNKNVIFNSYLPIVNKKIFVMENTSKGKFTSIAVSDVIDVIKKWVVFLSKQKTSDKYLDHLMSYTTCRLANLYKDYFINYIGKKKGVFRKHVYGARSHFTFRSVITSIPGEHDYDEIILPWSVIVTLMRPFILNKLDELGFNYKESIIKIFKAVDCYDEIIDKIIQNLIDESNYKKLSFLAQRNPSLLQGSCQLVFCKRYWKDPRNKTCSVSPKIIKACNGDYDGDALNFTMLIEKDLTELFMTLSPHYSAPDPNKVHGVSSYLTLLGPGHITMSNFLLDSGLETSTEDKVVSLLKLKNKNG